MAGLSKAGTHHATFFIVDAHAVTIDYDSKSMPQCIFDKAMTYLAAGIDPDSSLVFVQSDVHEQAEQAWYLSTVTTMGDLYRMTQFDVRRAMGLGCPTSLRG